MGEPAASLAGFEAWIDAHGLRDELGGLVHTVGTWVTACAPPGHSPRAIALACTDLCVFFTLDDAADDDAADRHARYLRLLERDGDGDVLGPDATALERATVTLLRDLRALGRPMTRYRADRRALVHAYARRARVRRGAPITFDELLRLRMITIYADAWTTLWEMLAAPGAMPDVRDAEEQAAVDEVTRWQALVNDLVSLPRDVARGEANLVLAVERERGLTRAAACADVATRAARSRRRIDDALAPLAARDDGGRGRWLAGALRVSVEGAERHYRGADPARYQPTQLTAARG